MSALFGDGRHEKRKHASILPRCGSCSQRMKRLKTLPVSGFRRCLQCYEDTMGVCAWPDRWADSKVASVAPQPHLPVALAVPTSQPTVYRQGPAVSATDSKQRQANEDVA